MEFQVRNVAQIAQADMRFGDLTVLVGPQGAGKSVLLQLFKLAIDRAYVEDTMASFGQDWQRGNPRALLDAYLGLGMGRSWNESSQMLLQGEPVDLASEPKGHPTQEALFYIPAQRAISMPAGWPQPYRAYRSTDPFVLKNFSEALRTHMDNISSRENIFPANRKLKDPMRELIDLGVFHGAKVSMGDLSMQRQVVLKVGGGRDNYGVSYTAWSTGQREFFPFLMSCYRLLPSSKKTKDDNIQWVVIEEPEMGLHPRAIFSSVLPLVFDMLHRGYRVVISTHSPSVLEALWAIREINARILSKYNARDRSNKVKLISEMMGLKTTRKDVKDMVGSLLEKKIQVYGFQLGQGKDHLVHVKDISTLDPSSDDPDISGWGGIVSYSCGISETVAKAEREAIR